MLTSLSALDCVAACSRAAQSRRQLSKAPCVRLRLRRPAKNGRGYSTRRRSLGSPGDRVHDRAADLLPHTRRQPQSRRTRDPAAELGWRWRVASSSRSASGGARASKPTKLRKRLCVSVRLFGFRFASVDTEDKERDGREAPEHRRNYDRRTRNGHIYYGSQSGYETVVTAHMENNPKTA